MGNRSILHLFPALHVGVLEVTVCELTYYHRWLNIGDALGNNQVSTGQSTLKIPDGYYTACEPDDVLQPLAPNFVCMPQLAGWSCRQRSVWS